MSKTCYVDLDGVLFPYPDAWLRYLKKRVATPISSLIQAKQDITHDIYTNLKKEYRSSPYKYLQPTMEGASRFTDSLYDKGYEIIICTTRPSNHPKLILRTINWLNQKKIIYHDVFFGSGLDFVAKHPDLSFGVDDELPIVEQLRKWGYQMFWIGETTFEEILRKV